MRASGREESAMTKERDALKTARLALKGASRQYIDPIFRESQRGCLAVLLAHERADIHSTIDIALRTVEEALADAPATSGPRKLIADVAICAACGHPHENLAGARVSDQSGTVHFVLTCPLMNRPISVQTITTTSDPDAALCARAERGGGA